MKNSCNRILNNNENEQSIASVYVLYKRKVEEKNKKLKTKNS